MQRVPEVCQRPSNAKLPLNKAERIVVYRAIVPHMIGWLPAEEGAQLRLEFETELAWLEAASLTPSASAGR